MERVEDLQFGGLKILRQDDLPGYTTDAVLQADFAKNLKGTRVCDLGTGTGIIPLLLLGRRPDLAVTGLEINAQLAALALKSAALNGLEDQFSVMQGDLRQAERLLPGASYDAVICCPRRALASQTKGQALYMLSCRTRVCDGRRDARGGD